MVMNWILLQESMQDEFSFFFLLFFHSIVYKWLTSFDPSLIDLEDAAAPLPGTLFPDDWELEIQEDLSLNFNDL